MKYYVENVLYYARNEQVGKDFSVAPVLLKKVFGEAGGAFAFPR